MRDIMKIAKQYGLGLHKAYNGVYVIEFPAINGKSPILVTADDGDTWCPDAMQDNKKMWSGECSLIGCTLAQEIKDMFKSLNLKEPGLMLTVASQLSELSTGKIFS